MFFNSIALVTFLLAGTSMAGDLIWDGRFNDTSAADLDKWSWSNQVGAYQYYIHGTGATSDYINIGADNVNPADTSSTDGARITIDTTSSWNGQNMMRTELIPSTTAAINKGKKFYHLSVKHTLENAPDAAAEHQVAFFESHFTELKFGASGSKKLQWMADGTSKFDMDFAAGVWHNVAYGIDFDASTVEFFHSTGADELVSKAGPVSASVSSNGADWHVGVLRLPGSEATEDWYFSSVYIEDGELTTSVSGPGGESSGTAAKAPTSSSVAAVSASSGVKSVSTSAAAVVVSSQVAVVSTTTIPTSSAVPTTLQTMISSSSSSAVETSAVAVASSAVVAASSTSASQAAPAQTGADDGCAVEYVYI